MVDFKAPAGQFRVIGADTFDGGDWLQGDFASVEEAKDCADTNSGTMLKMHVYNDRAEHLYEAGTF